MNAKKFLIELNKRIPELILIFIILNQIIFFYHTMYLYSWAFESNIIPQENLKGISSALELQAFVIGAFIVLLYAYAVLCGLRLSKAMRNYSKKQRSPFKYKYDRK